MTVHLSRHISLILLVTSIATAVLVTVVLWPRHLAGVPAGGEGGHAGPVVVFGGVVPHHTLVQAEMDRFWEVVAAQTRLYDIATIVLVGPDHADAGVTPVTTAADMNHVFAPPVVNPLADEVIHQLVSFDMVAVDSVVQQSEYSLDVHQRSIEKNFPHARIVPLLIRADASVSDVQRVAEGLRANLTQPTLVVASVDFSHYRSESEANTFDEETRTAIEQYDYAALHSYNEEHLDSEQSIILLSELVCPAHECSWEVLYHGNSASYSGTNPFRTTSYFSLLLDATVDRVSVDE